MTTPGLIFESSTHTYTLGGRKLPSVTGILEAVGMIDKTYYTEEARDRGAAVHAAIHYLDENDLDRATVDPRITPYLTAYERFMDETGFESLTSEMVMASSVHGYGGMLDRLGWFRDERLGIADFKTGPWQKWHDVQLAAYRRLVIENAESLGIRAGDLSRSMTVVCLKANGRYTLHPVRNPLAAESVWNSALSLHKFLNP